MKKEQAKEGRPIESYDILLVGTSRSRNLTFVTNNVSAFSGVEDLTIENWVRAS